MLLSLLAAAAVQAAPAAPEPPKLSPPPKPTIRAFSCQTIRPLPTPVQQAPVGKAPRSTPWGAAPLHSLAQEPDAAMLRPVLRINHCNDEDVLRLNVSSEPSPAAPRDSLGQNAPQQRGR